MRQNDLAAWCHKTICHFNWPQSPKFCSWKVHPFLRSDFNQKHASKEINRTNAKNTLETWCHKTKWPPFPEYVLENASNCWITFLWPETNLEKKKQKQSKITNLYLSNLSKVFSLKFSGPVFHTFYGPNQAKNKQIIGLLWLFVCALRQYLVLRWCLFLPVTFFCPSLFFSQPVIRSFLCISLAHAPSSRVFHLRCWQFNLETHGFGGIPLLPFSDPRDLWHGIWLMSACCACVVQIRSNSTFATLVASLAAARNRSDFSCSCWQLHKGNL